MADPGPTGDNIEDGAQALQSLKQTGYDFVIPHMQRSVPGGYEIMKKKRAQAASQDLPGDKQKLFASLTNACFSRDVSKNKVLEVLSGLPKKIANGTSTEISSVHARPEVRSVGLDVENAVRELGVNVTIYCKILRAFCRDYKDMEAEFSKAIATEDLDGIQKRMHSLKGSSSTLGAEDLCNMASKLDLLCREKQFPVAGQLDELLAELQSVIRDAEQIVSEGYSEPEECDEILAVISATGLEEGLQALAVALDESLYDEINSEMNKIEGNLTGSPVSSLGKMIRMYAYDDALELLREICAELNILLHDDMTD